MKAHTRSKSRPTLPKRPLPSATTDRILDRVEAVTKEVDALQAEIYRRINDETRSSPNGSGEENASSARVLAEFKVALDRLRHVLWFYLEQVTGKVERAPRQMSESGRPRRISYPQSHTVDTPSAAPGSFFDRLDVVIDAYMKNTAPRGEAGPRKRAKN